MYSATCIEDFTPQGEPCDDSSTTADMCPLDYGGTGDGCQPPNLITSLINIALSPGSVDEPMYSGQGFVQVSRREAFGSTRCVMFFASSKSECRRRGGSI